jgi:sulfur carrier protein
MHILLNGREAPLEAGLHLLGLLEARNLSPDTVVVELNGLIIEKARYGQTLLQDRDQVEILRFVGGG